MPGLAEWLCQKRQDDGLSSATPERVQLYLPSFFSDPSARKAICASDLAQIEESLRYAGAHESLSGLCSQLRMRTFISRERETYRGSQALFTCSHSAQITVEDQIKLHRDQYRLHRAALLNLRGNGDWQMSLQELTNEDVQGISEKTLKDLDNEDYRRAILMAGVSEFEADQMEQDRLPPSERPSLYVGNGKRIISWIWTSRAGGPGGGSGVDDHGADISVTYSLAYLHGRPEGGMAENKGTSTSMERRAHSCRRGDALQSGVL
jgi:hypothetical protein